MKESISSKKFLFAIGVVVVGFVYALIAAIWLPNMAPMYETFVGLLEMITAAYILGNVSNKYVLGRVAPKAKKADPEPADPLERDTPSK